jgi:hypothetical protein
MTASTILAAAAPGTGGAPLWQLVVLGAIYWGGTAAVIGLVFAHRSGRTRLLARAASGAGWVFRLPGWSALPVMLAVVGLLAAMWAGVWDIGYHIDYGRDTGPLGNPAHLPLLLGIFVTFVAGILAIGLADQDDATPAWVRIRAGWRAPLGGVLLASCMAFGMAALALDDVWHRIFGQDVTLWSPTHFIYLCGGVLTVIGMLVLLKEGSIARARRRDLVPARTDAATNGGALRLGEFSIPKLAVVRIELLQSHDLAARIGRVVQRVQRAALLGGLLCGLELFLTEYDYGVPLYRQVWQPLLLAAFAAFIFTAARAWVGRGAALGACAVYLLVRLTGILVPLLAGVSPSSMPLFIVEALCVELLAVRLDARRRPLTFGVGAGLLCGTVGFAAEYGWSQVAMPLPWTPAVLPEGAILAALGGLGAGVLGALFASAMRGQLPTPRVTRLACVGAFALLIGLATDAATKHVPNVLARVQLTDVRRAPHREAIATVHLRPASAADGANWLYILAWQGHAPRVVDRLARVSEGVYRSTRPIPLYGSWKVGLRLNNGRARGAVPMRLPVDRGLPNALQHIPAVLTADQLKHAMQHSAGAELPAPASFTRPFGDDNLIVLRETKGNVAGWVWTVAIGLTAIFWSLFVAGLALGLGRIGRRATPGAPRPRPRAGRPSQPMSDPALSS